MRIATTMVFLIAAWLLPLGAAADTDVELDLYKETGTEIQIAIPPFAGTGPGQDQALAEEARQILETNLHYFELFAPMDPVSYTTLVESEGHQSRPRFLEWSRIGAQWLVKTQFRTEGLNGGVQFVFRLYDVVHNRYLMGKRYQGGRQYVRVIMRRFADELMDQLTGIRGVAETQIAFLAASEEGKELYSVDFDGENVNQISNEQSVVLSPNWSPDRRTIVFTSYRDRNPNMVLMSINGDKRRTLLDIPGLNSAPSWSPDGKRIALSLSKDENSEIYTLSRWNELTRLTRHFNIDTSPTWSPDGKRIAFTSDRAGAGRPQIYVMDAEDGDRQGVRRITFDSWYNDNPAWSPDGDKIAYTSRVGDYHQIRLFFPETGKTALFTQGPSNKEEPSWSPDGRFLAYRVARGRYSSVHIKGFNGKPSRQLTHLPQGSFSPTWSPYPRRYLGGQNQ
ncbi:hypothetical protein [Nitrospina watsonii]|uniref:TolB protein, periplasmic protein involved in the tonb-independent uptake of group A colicins n=1 Tax=Nitrospina watsonii TaxID=1323948 RepID=A0ABN8W0R0_9BACT|nr:hypothetical protein [Nitrospina watsonii]CAI2719168.1 tolB protein precursor, periplasmic protein involved in the tonb-independent uptake of group A colicins [Nitrospina watsonii]